MGKADPRRGGIRGLKSTKPVLLEQLRQKNPNLAPFTSCLPDEMRPFR